MKAGVACEVASRSLSFRFQILRDNETRTRVSATARHPQQPGHGHTCARGIIGVGSRARGRCRRALALGPARHATQGKVSEHRRWRSGCHLARGGGGGTPDTSREEGGRALQTPRARRRGGHRRHPVISREEEGGSTDTSREEGRRAAQTSSGESVRRVGQASRSGESVRRVGGTGSTDTSREEERRAQQIPEQTSYCSYNPRQGQ